MKVTKKKGVTGEEGQVAADRHGGNVGRESNMTR